MPKDVMSKSEIRGRAICFLQVLERELQVEAMYSAGMLSAVTEAAMPLIEAELTDFPSGELGAAIFEARTLAAKWFRDSQGPRDYDHRGLDVCWVNQSDEPIVRLLGDLLRFGNQAIESDDSVGRNDSVASLGDSSSDHSGEEQPLKHDNTTTLDAALAKRSKQLERLLIARTELVNSTTKRRGSTIGVLNVSSQMLGDWLTLEAFPPQVAGTKKSSFLMRFKSETG